MKKRGWKNYATRNITRNIRKPLFMRLCAVSDVGSNPTLSAQSFFVKDLSADRFSFITSMLSIIVFQGTNRNLKKLSSKNSCYLREVVYSLLLHKPLDALNELQHGSWIVEVHHSDRNC